MGWETFYYICYNKNVPKMAGHVVKQAALVRSLLSLQQWSWLSARLYSMLLFVCMHTLEHLYIKEKWTTLQRYVQWYSGTCDRSQHCGLNRSRSVGRTKEVFSHSTRMYGIYSWDVPTGSLNDAVAASWAGSIKHTKTTSLKTLNDIQQYIVPTMFDAWPTQLHALHLLATSNLLLNCTITHFNLQH